MTVRFKFKPIVPVPNWREEAAAVIDLMLRETKPDNLSMAALMWMQVEDLKACIPTDLLDPDFLAAAEAAHEQLRGNRLAPFPDAKREELYRHYLAEIRKHDADIPVAISTESLDMWKRLGPELGFTPSNYVCGCGAGATPDKQRLATNPWQDARGACDWQGNAVVEESGGVVCVRTGVTPGT